MNLRIGKVYCGNEEVLLTAMEYRLLLIFLNHRGQVLSRGQILDQIWDGAGEFVNDNTLTVYVGRLRKKLGDTEKEPLIETVPGRRIPAAAVRRKNGDIFGLRGIFLPGGVSALPETGTEAEGADPLSSETSGRGELPAFESFEEGQLGVLQSEIYQDGLSSG